MHHLPDVPSSPSLMSAPSCHRVRENKLCCSSQFSIKTVFIWIVSGVKVLKWTIIAGKSELTARGTGTRHCTNEHTHTHTVKHTAVLLGDWRCGGGGRRGLVIRMKSEWFGWVLRVRNAHWRKLGLVVQAHGTGGELVLGNHLALQHPSILGISWAETRTYTHYTHALYTMTNLRRVKFRRITLTSLCITTTGKTRQTFPCSWILHIHTTGTVWNVV